MHNTTTSGMKTAIRRVLPAAIAWLSCIPLTAEVVKSAASPEITNPVMPEDFPDPFLLRVGPWFYAWASNSQTANVPVARTRDFAKWERLPDAMARLDPG